MESALVDQASEQFLGQWKRLVSTTNWEKGRIIHEWREALRAAEAPPAEYSDEAWSRHVGNVTPQHVGRLRRVHERFAGTRESYAGLFWSHFQAALDWDDAPLWLEGAVQSDWSIADMRRQRHESLGELGGSSLDEQPAEPWDEDADVADAAEVASGAMETVRAPAGDEPYQPTAEDEEAAFDHAQFDDGQGIEAAGAAEPDEAPRPFAELPPLPPDVNDAFESYKLCIVRHKLAGWAEISRGDMLLSLDSLKQLAIAPS